MLRWIVRLGLVRMLGRRAVPVIMAYDAVRMVRDARRRWMRPAPPRDEPPPT